MRSKTADSNPLMVSSSNHERFSWRETLFSERGTLIAIALGIALLYVKLKTGN